ncbi:MAG: hypothetical protein ACK5JF_00035 [Oscillospiraceae bacterium]
MDAVINYKCPNCSAPLVFGIESQKWECHFCNSTFPKEEIEKFSQQEGAAEAQEAEAAVPRWAPDTFKEEEAVTYTCPSCGGSVLADKQTAATFCVFCHNPTIIAKNLSGEYRPAKIIPFKLTKDKAEEALLKLCKGKPLLPRFFRDIAKKGEVRGLYVPYWLFSADYHAQLSGTGRNISIWRDSTYEYTKTDTYQIERAGTFPFRMVPQDASSRMEDKLMEGLEPFDNSLLEEFAMQYLSGHFAESFDVDAATCQQRFRVRANTAVEQGMRATVTGYSSTSVAVNTHTIQDYQTMYVMLPIWLLQTKFKNKVYTFAMNGQSGRMVGKLPFSWGRILAWFGGFAGLIGLITFLIGGFFL